MILRVVFLVLAVSQPVWADSLIRGQVRDESGAVVAGALIRLIDSEKHVLAETRTDKLGSFQLALEQPGGYLLEARLAGFENAVQAIETRGAVTLVNFRLRVARVRYEVTVEEESAGVSLQPAQNADAVTLSAEDLEMLPSLDQDLISMAGVFLADDGPPDLVVDGVERESFQAPPESIAEIRVNRNPYSAEFSRPGRRRIEVTTKGAASEFRGSASLNYRNSALDARNAFATRRLPFSRESVGLSLSGPLIRKGKLGFFLAANQEESNRAQPILAVLPEGLLQSDALSGSREFEFTGRLDGQLSNVHSWAARVSSDRERDDNINVGGFNLPERAQERLERETEVSFSLTSVVSPQALNHLRSEFERDTRSLASLIEKPAVIVNGAFSFGGGQEQSSRRNDRWEIHDVFSRSTGTHSVRAGAGGRANWAETTDRSNFGGTFEFLSLGGFVAQRPLFYRQNRGNPLVRLRYGEFYGFLQDNGKIRPNLNVWLGLRYETETVLPDRNNIGPRLGLAWAPGQSQNTVLRGGFGWFYEQRTSRLRERSLFYESAGLQSLLITNPGYPDPFASGGEATLLPSNIVSVAANVRSPYLLMGSVSLERQIVGKTIFVLEYRVERGLHLFRSRNLNAPLPGTGFRPLPELGNWDQYESSASSREQALGLTLRGRWRVLDFSTQYRYQRSFSDTEEAGFLPASNFDFGPEWGRASNDRRHRLRLVSTAKLPQNFRVGLITSFSSGAPYDILTGNDDNQDSVVRDRPAGVNRNTGQGPGYANVNIRLGRLWKLSDSPGRKLTLDTAAEAFNLFNRTNFGNYVGNLQSPFFGRATSASDPRRLQFSVRFRF